MSYIKVSNPLESSNKCFRFDCPIYTKCRVPISHIKKLPYILGLYDSIDTLIIIIDISMIDFMWENIRPFESVKHLLLDGNIKFCNRPNVLPNDFWRMFPNLETIIIHDIFIPVNDLDMLSNLNTFMLIHGKSKLKKTDSKIQDIIQILSNMTTLIDVQIISNQKCYIPDELFMNNQGLKYIHFAMNTIVNNIPSILNCHCLLWMCVKINLLDNMYILDLANLEQFEIYDIPISADGSEIIDDNRIIPDEIFARPIFMTCSTRCSSIKPLNYCASKIIRGDNYEKAVSQALSKQERPNTREVAGDHFLISEQYFPYNN